MGREITMSKNGPSNSHILPEEVLGFMEKTLPRAKLKEIEEHLCECMECLEHLATVVRSDRPPTEEEREALSQIPARSPDELLERLRPHIIATSPGSQPRDGVRSPWGKLLVATAAIAVVVALFALIQSLILSPARSRQVASQAMSDLVTLRRGTGRIPLRYIPGFGRARVTRSGFDIEDPNEDLIETRLRQAVDLGPREVESRIALGLFLLDSGNLDEARRHLSQALVWNPDSLLARNGLAVVCYEEASLNRSRADTLLQEGLALLREARRQDPEDLQVAFNLGKYMEVLGQPELARRAWVLYLEQDDSSEWAQVALENLEALR